MEDLRIISKNVLDEQKLRVKMQVGFQRMFIMDLGKAFKGQAFTPIEQIVPALKDASEERPKKQDWKRDKANFMRWVEGFKNG